MHAKRILLTVIGFEMCCSNYGDWVRRFSHLFWGRFVRHWKKTSGKIHLHLQCMRDLNVEGWRFFLLCLIKLLSKVPNGGDHHRQLTALCIRLSPTDGYTSDHVTGLSRKNEYTRCTTSGPASVEIKTNAVVDNKRNAYSNGTETIFLSYLDYTRTACTRPWPNE